MSTELISLYGNMTVTERQDKGGTAILVRYQFPARRWWQRLTMRAYSPVWRRYRGARMLWVSSCDHALWLRLLLVLHALFAPRPFVQWQIVENPR